MCSLNEDKPVPAVPVKNLISKPGSCPALVPNTEEYDSNSITSVSGMGICGLHFQANGPRRALLSTGPPLMSLQSYTSLVQRGLARLHQAHFRASFHVCHSICPRLPLSLSSRRSRMWAPSTNYRSPCQLKGPLPTAKPLDDIIKGVHRVIGET